MRRCPAKARYAAGFTLIEAAIVLVVIGLILGVVLQGQSLIRNAEYRSFQTSISDYQSAFYEFRDRYSALPGDFSRADTRLGLGGNPNGDGNGIIDDGPGCTNASDETCLAWRHLRGARLISGNPETAGNESRPTHPFAGAFDGFFTGSEGNGVFENKLFITDVPADIAQRMDDQIDDQEPDSGRVSCNDCDYEDDDRVDLIITL